MDRQAAFYKIAFNLHSNPDIKDLQLYMLDGIASIEETNEFKSLESVKQTEWYKILLKSTSNYFWFPANYFPESNSNSQIFFLEKIHGNSASSDFLGVIKVDIDENVIKNLLKEAVFTKSTSVILTNSKNELVSSSGNADTEILSTISETNPNDSSSAIWKIATVNNRKLLMGVQSIPKTNMKLSIVIPYKDILGLNVKLRNQMLIILLIVILIILPLSFWVSGSGTKRIRLLIKHMKKIQKGDIITVTLPSAKDEIGDLISNFNYMIEEIHVLMEDKFKLGKKLKNIELKALQAQINPHFLYNTLDLN